MDAATVLTDEEIRAKKYALGVIAPDEFFNKIARAIEQAVLQSDEVQKLREDAERYRYLRDEAETSPRDVFCSHWLVDLPEPITLDSAIDAAMKEQP